MERALVTGGSRSIGRGIVQRLIEDGYEVVILDRVEPDPPLQTRWINVDLTDTDAIHAALDDVIKDGPITRVCHNVGHVKPALLDDTTLEDFDALLNDPGPMAVIDELGDWAVILWVAAWVDQRNTDITKAKSESLRLIKQALDTAGIRMPNPTYTIQSAEGAPHPEPAKPAKRPVAVPEAVAGDTSVERVMDEAVNRDRESADAPDLLQDDAGKE